MKKTLKFKGLAKTYEVNDPPTLKEFTDCMDDLSQDHKLLITKVCGYLEEAISAIEYVAERALDGDKEVLANMMFDLNDIKSKLLTGR